MLCFPLPVDLNGEGLTEELRTAGYLHPVVSVTVEAAEEVLAVSCDDESDEAGIGAVVAAHTGALTETQQLETDWRIKIESEIAFLDGQVKTWPVDLVAGQTVNQVGQRVNFTSAAVKRLARNQQRILRYILDSTMDVDP